MIKRLLPVLGIVLVVSLAIGFRVLNDSLESHFSSLGIFLAQVSPGPSEALFFVSPTAGIHKVNDTFQVEVRVGASTGVTAIRAYLNFDPSVLSVTNISTIGSAFAGFFLEETSVSGQVRIQATKPTPGFLGNNGLIAVVTFQAVGNGSANLIFDASSLALGPQPSYVDILNIEGSTTGSYIVDSVAPSRFSGLPTGSLPSQTTSTIISLTTNENATCKYSQTPGVAFSSMTGTFSPLGSTSHSATVGGLSSGSSFSYFVRCQDNYGNSNSSDFPIQFSVNATPDSTPPVLSNNQPTGTLPSGTTGTTISLETDEAATCRYSTTPALAYSSMLNTMSVAGGGVGSISGALVYTDRSYTFVSLPSVVTGVDYIKTANNDKNVTGNSLISFAVDKSATVYIAHDDRIVLKPSWLNSFSQTSDDVTIDGNTHSLWKKSVSAGLVTLGGNAGTSESSNYSVFVVGASVSNLSAISAHSYEAVQGNRGTKHNATVSGLSDGNSFSYFVKCKDGFDNENIGDFPIAFSVNSPAPTPDIIPPSRFGASPTGILAAGTTQTAMQITTDENAICKYSSTQNTTYAAMTGIFSSTGNTLHSTTISALSNGQSYTYYVRCQDDGTNENTDDFPITFSVPVGADVTAPLRSNNQPSGTLAAGTASVILSLQTDEDAICKYGTVSATYAFLPNTFTNTGNLSHSASVSTSNGQTYTYYVRCQDGVGNFNSGDLPIEFTVANPVIVSGGGGSSGSGGGGSSPILMGIIGDCDSGGKVNVFDLSILLSNWLKTTDTCDLNRDGKINIFDFSIMLSNWTG